MMSKFRNHNAIWHKVDTNTKWKPEHIVDILHNQSYLIELDDGRQFRRNEHHITGQHPHPRNGAKPLDGIKCIRAFFSVIYSQSLIYIWSLLTTLWHHNLCKIF